MFALPIWSSCMLLSIYLEDRRTQSTRLRQLEADEHHLLTPIDAHAAESRMPRRPTRSSKFEQSMYLSISLVGLLLFATRHPSEASRHSTKVWRATKELKREGHWVGEKVYIAALFYNNEPILPQWTREMIKVIRVLGPDNVYVSVMESWSTDRTALLLEEFDRSLEALNVKRRVLTKHNSIRRPDPFLTDKARIEFLAASRNVPLESLQSGETGMTFDRLLYSNDVLFTAETVIELLSTRYGDYDMACGLDFSPWGVCDGWVMRDRLGGFFSSLWPYIVEPAGMDAVSVNKPAQVLSCWNGIAAFRAEPFLPPQLRRNRTLSDHPLPPPPVSHPGYSLNQGKVPQELPALEFRGSALQECFSSECLLMPYDLRVLYGLNGIYVNPRVLVAYTWENYALWVRLMRHWLVRWWIEGWERGSGMHDALWIEGRHEDVWMWEGGACQVFNGYTRPSPP
ncbi:cryptococcal mannosyltransferase 1-domain-containing protein [Auriculariales sp. MPI-PUGE-AT-0066]|nr:cryptococcal mannosyltransferase 1-domain-containing protein [Auriculariales sp. MPI-PUGE-AT-0066]